MLFRRYGSKEGFLSFLGPGLFYVTIALVIGYLFWPYSYHIKNEHIVAIGVFTFWRYSWLFINYIRSIIYHYILYPKLKKRAIYVWKNKKHLRPQRIYFVIPSYKEEPWITLEMLQSLLSELSHIPCEATLIISTGSDEEDHIIATIFESHPVSEKVELVLQRQSEGKRIAMGDALRAVARRYYRYEEDYNSVTFLMDGDTVISPKTLRRVISFFMAYPNLGALTTNEVAYISTPSKWYRDWFNMKFGQRQVMFGSHALSKRVLTLTGRFSAFRTAVVVREDFIKKVEEDYLEHPLFGKFRFLMGDDKSTWFYILKERWDMLYLPDCICYALESRRENFVRVSLQLLFRWYGNTLRNNKRALKLGPKGVGGKFIWLAILDQKISMWTALVGITSAVTLSLAVSPVYLPMYLAWVLFVRTLQMGTIATLGGHLVSYRTVPLMLYNQWVGALVKIWVNYHLAYQKWSKGEEEQDSEKWWIKIKHPLAPILPNFAMLTSILMFLFFIMLSERILAVPDPHILLSAVSHFTAEGTSETIIKFPAGIIEIRKPIVVDRPEVKIIGAGIDKTILKAKGMHTSNAVLLIRGKAERIKFKLKRDVSIGSSILEFEFPPGLKRGDILLIRRPNNEAFLRKIGSMCWKKRYPYIRQEIVEVKRVIANYVFLDRALFFSFPRGETEIFRISGPRDVLVKDLTIMYEVKKDSASPPKHIYKNLYPDEAVDLIRVEYASYIRLENLKLINAGRHALNLDRVYRVRVENVVVDGAWNKGRGGNGYLRLARAYMCDLRNLQVSSIRHIAIQWSSAYNLLSHIYSEVDLNFHGGYPHHNTVQDITFNIPEEHPWKGVVFIPKDVCFAPPNGPKNEVLGIRMLNPPARKPQGFLKRKGML